jgi:hypothetical protein
MGTASRNAAESLAERRCAPRLAAANPRNSAPADQWSCGKALGALGGSCAIASVLELIFLAPPDAGTAAAAPARG